MIKSFEVNHTLMTAPTIRLADTYQKGDVIVEKYDLRFVTPNTTYIDDKTMHSMEHLLATSFKKQFQDDMIDLSPMGCKTGFYFTVFKTDITVGRIIKAIEDSSEIEIPTPTKNNCGSYLLHNIEGARCFLKRISELL